MEFGVYTFADVVPDATDKSRSTHQRFTELIEEIRVADELGLDVFGLGEHHRPDYAVSSPSTVLAAAAVLTKRIKLTSAVTVLSSEDPVRVYQQFATIDQLSGGRAEIMVGRGSFIESFPLFGFDLDDYDALFAEKLEMLLALNRGERVTWKGKHTQDLEDAGIYPRPFQPALPIWQAAGGTPASAVRAGTIGLPLALAIIGGMPRQFVPFVNLYKKAWNEQGHAAPFQLGINTHVYVAEDSQQAAREYFPSYAEVMRRIGRERGWPPLTTDQFEYMRSPEGSLMVGSPQQIIDKILYEHELFGFTRFLAQMRMGDLSHALHMKSMELFATKVLQAVREGIAHSA
jgi:probable LLM family oxidoreductase